MKRFLLSLLFVGMAGTAQAQAGTNAGTTKVTEDFFVSGLQWGGARGSLDYAIRIDNADGVFRVCGVLAYNNSIGRNENNNAARAFKLLESNKTILRGFHWMPVIRRGSSFVGQTAKCRLTVGKVVANPDFDIQLAKNRF